MKICIVHGANLTIMLTHIGKLLYVILLVRNMVFTEVHESLYSHQFLLNGDNTMSTETI